MKLNSILSLVVSILHYSTAHGVANVMRTDLLLIKIMWSILFLMSFSTCFYYITSNLLNFFEYPVISNIQVYSEMNSKFPTVSFCSLDWPQNAPQAEVIANYGIESYLNISRFNGLNLYYELIPAHFFLAALNYNRLEFYVSHILK